MWTVYKLECQKCDCVYIGSCKGFKKRMSAHKSFAKSLKKKYKVYLHFHKHDSWKSIQLCHAKTKYMAQNLEMEYLMKVPKERRLNTRNPHIKGLTIVERESRVIYNRFRNKGRAKVKTAHDDLITPTILDMIMSSGLNSVRAYIAVPPPGSHSHEVEVAKPFKRVHY